MSSFEQRVNDGELRRVSGDAGTTPEAVAILQAGGVAAWQGYVADARAAQAAAAANETGDGGPTSTGR